MEKSLQSLANKLRTLSIFRSLSDTQLMEAFFDYIIASENKEFDEQLSSYGAFCNALYKEGGDLSEYIRKFVIEDENFFLVNMAKSVPMNDAVNECLRNELDTLQELAALRPSVMASAMGYMEYDGFLPSWQNTRCSIKKDYFQMLTDIPTKGYGLFAKYHVFKVKDTELLPIKNPDSQSLNELYGYTRERNMVLENTRALVSGKPASNVLLYGDAGTGKSSTIKACAKALEDQGLRLVEFTKDQLAMIPVIIDKLYDSPLKFIFYIDDLTFNANDDSFAALKGILEGNATGSSRNIAIYATSNRRHLVREDSEARKGTDLHLNDTLQETMSLSARFGLTITFSKPEKDLYLEIVSSMAKEYNISMDEKELFIKAEAFAIRASGRSPRTAKQFIEQVVIGLK